MYGSENGGFRVIRVCTGVVGGCCFLSTHQSPLYSPPVEPLQPPDSIHLEAVRGWIELKNYEEVFEELDGND